MELAIHGLKNGLEMRNVKKMDCITQFDKDMDDMLIEFISKSGRVMIPALSQRGPSANSNIGDSKGQAVILN